MIKLRLIAKFLILIFCLATIYTQFCFAESSNGSDASEIISVEINGVVQNYPQPPIIINDRVLIPLRAIFESLGTEVLWDDALQQVTAQRNDMVIIIKIGDVKTYVNGQEKLLTQPAIIVNDRTFVPVRFVNEALGADVSWNEETSSVVITSPLPVASKPITVFLIGDSIVEATSPAYYPREGWGQMLKSKFTKEVRLKNYAIGGRSSKSYLVEPNWNIVKNSMKKGDYLFIQFGHNDRAQEEYKRTDPNTTYKDNLKIYVDAAKAKGAIPILVTPPSGLNFIDGIAVNSIGGFPQAMRDFAKDNSIYLIDLNEKSLILYNTLGEEGCKQHLFMFYLVEQGLLTQEQFDNYPDPLTKRGKDGHFKIEGADKLADFIVEGIKELNIPLAGYLE